MAQHDLIITNARVVRPGHEPERLDVAVKDGVFTAFEPHLDPSTADEVVDAGGKHLFPGVVDVHQHWGIYNEARRGRRDREQAPRCRAA